jgi:hypothetical protein
MKDVSIGQYYNPKVNARRLTMANSKEKVCTPTPSRTDRQTSQPLTLVVASEEKMQ